VPAPRATRTNRQTRPAQVPRISKLVHTSDAAGRQRREVHFARPESATAPPRQSFGDSQRNSSGGNVPSYSQVRGQAKQVSAATPKLAAEWLVCVIMIGATSLTKEGDYGVKMGEALWRITAVTLLFFILALVSMNESMKQITVAFGGLIVITILAKGAGEIKKVLDAAGGAGTGEDKDVLTADLNPNAPVPHNILQ
jgi:hypothetical protein